MKKQKIVAVIILACVVAFIIFLKFYNFESFSVHIKHEKQVLNKMPFVIVLSLTIALLLVLIFEKRKDFWTAFNFLWIFALTFTVNYYFMDYYTYRTFDFMMSKKMKINSHTKYIDRYGWANDDFTIGKDTLNLAQNPSVESVYGGKFKIRKSRFQRYYYLQKDEDQ